eukprot:339715-Prorocentrum_minimum.AAC.1
MPLELEDVLLRIERGTSRLHLTVPHPPSVPPPLLGAGGHAPSHREALQGGAVLAEGGGIEAGGAGGPPRRVNLRPPIGEG